MDAYGICPLSQIPIRETISHSSELVSQFLFGDIFHIEDKYQNWLKVESCFDHFQGWVDEKQIKILKPESVQAFQQDSTQVFIGDFSAVVERATDHALFSVGMGSRLPLYENGNFKIGEIPYKYTGKTIEPLTDPIKRQQQIVQNASTLLYTPYLWGGKSVFGTDCSGFTQLIYRISGITLSRNASEQAMQGKTVLLLNEAQVGDLLFFDNENGDIVHVGIYLSDNRIIHASGYVRIDPVDHQGIFKQEISEYTHNLRLIKRMI
ncbi:MAG: C40 family peptidase [Bacteroidales bacterium]